MKNSQKNKFWQIPPLFRNIHYQLLKRSHIMLPKITTVIFDHTWTTDSFRPIWHNATVMSVLKPNKDQ